jgi:hypothetical protein
MKTKWCRKWRRTRQFYFQCPAVDDGSCLVGSVCVVCLVPSVRVQTKPNQTEQLSNRVSTADPRPANERCDSMMTIAQR